MFYLIAKPHLRRDTYLGESYFSDTHDSIIANISPDSWSSNSVENIKFLAYYLEQKRTFDVL